MVNVKNIRKALCEIGKLCYERNYLDASGGNISIRDRDKVYVTPRQAGEHHQWSIDEDSIIVTDMCKVPIIGEVDNITREAICHYYIYQAFPDIKAIVHGHPPFMMSFGAAHMDIPAVSEGTRCVISPKIPITNIEESVPGSEQQAVRIVENFKWRRQQDPDCGLICNIPFHGIFSAADDLNSAFLYVEVSETNCKILINRQIMFGNNPSADFSIHHDISREEISSIAESKEVCPTGFIYRDAFGNETTYKSGSTYLQPSGSNLSSELVSKITEEVLKKIKNS
ncbi:MAG: class II aldolase/adducin family protein [Actinobacteria bacterium]|nr:class II aldolase/adducin family protein [Actinomycetota bacterium]